MNEDQILNDLDERARAAVSNLKTEAEARPAPAFDPERIPTVPLTPAASATATIRRPFLAAAAAALVVALLATGLWFGTRNTGDSDVADEVVSGSIRPYLPEVVPEGMQLAGVAESDGSGEPEIYDHVGPLVSFGPASDDPRIAVVATAERSFAEASASSSDSGSEEAQLCAERLESGENIDSCPRGEGSDPGDEGSDDGPTTDARAEEIAVGDRVGYLHQDGQIPGLLLELPATDDADGPYIAVFGPEGDVDVLTAVAGATTLDGLEPTVNSGALPDGWRQLDSDPDGTALISPMGALRGALQVPSASGFFVDPSQQRSLVVSSLARPSTALHTQRLFLEAVEIVTVRGHEALVGRFPGGTSDNGEGVSMSWGEGWVVRWIERPGETISLGGLGLSRDELLAAAESVQPVEPVRWRELLEATGLGDLAPMYDDGRPSVEMGRGRFADGTAWVLRYVAAGTDEGGTYEESVSLDVAISGDSASHSSQSYSAVGTAIDTNGNPIEAPAPVFRSTSALEKAGRAFGSGLVREDVARIELRASDGNEVGDVEMVAAEGQVAWVAELPPNATTLVAFASDGTEIGIDELPSFSRADGSEEAPKPLLPGDVQDTTVPAPGPTTTGG